MISKMNSTILAIFIMIVMSFSLAPKAEAGTLIAGGCLIGGTIAPMGFHPVAFGPSCKQLEQFNDTFDLLEIGVIPLTTALMIPGVREALGQSAVAAAGAVMAAPAVATVTIISGTGIMVAYVVLKATWAECKAGEKQRLKQEILDDLANDYSLMAKRPASVPIKIKNTEI